MMGLIDKEANNLAKALVKYCENRGCTNCTFFLKDSLEHFCSINLPYRWELLEKGIIKK